MNEHDQEECLNCCSALIVNTIDNAHFPSIVSTDSQVKCSSSSSLFESINLSGERIRDRIRYDINHLQRTRPHIDRKDQWEMSGAGPMFETYLMKYLQERFAHRSSVLGNGRVSPEWYVHHVQRHSLHKFERQCSERIHVLVCLFHLPSTSLCRRSGLCNNFECTHRLRRRIDRSSTSSSDLLCRRRRRRKSTDRQRREARRERENKKKTAHSQYVVTVAT